MNKKILSLVLCMVLIITMLSGCRLASEDSKAVPSKEDPDIVCGVYVSFNPSPTEGDKNEGTERPDGTIEFTGLHGYYMGVKHVADKNGPYISNIADKEFQDISTAINVGDEKSNSNTYEGTLYFDRRFHQPIYLNRVYQRPNKTYYCVRAGAGAMVDEMGCGSLNIKASTEKKTNGKTIKQTEIFNVKFDVYDISNNVLIKEMNSKDQVIKTTEYHQTDSENYKVNKNTSYVIVEETFKKASGSEQIKRAIYSVDHKFDKDEDISHRLFYPGKEGALIPKLVHFKR